MSGLVLSALLLLSPSERDSILKVYPENAGFWREALTKYSGDTLSCVEYLFLTIPDEDRDEMTFPVLEDHVFGTLATRNNFYDDLPLQVFYEYLLKYRISDEPLSAYRYPLSAWLERRLVMQPTPYETAREIAAIIRSNIALTDETGEKPMAPTQVIPLGRASAEERWILTCAAFRAVGIPSRPVLGWFPGVEKNLYRWIDVWTGEEWQPVTVGMPPVKYVKVAFEYPSRKNITAEYRDTGTLVLMPIVNTVPGWMAELAIPSGEDTVPITSVTLNPFRVNELELGSGEFLLRVYFKRNGELVGSWVKSVYVPARADTTVDLKEAQYEILPLP